MSEPDVLSESCNIYNSAMNILGLIPARGGSERVPGKNLKPLDGKPLISYTIDASKSSRMITRTIVSTNSDEIAAVAREYGAEIPFMRPDEISKSDSTEMEFFHHTLDELKKNDDYVPDIIVLLYPTSPFRRPETIDKAVKEFLKHPEADSLRSVKLCSEHPYKMWVEKGGYLRPFVEGKDSNIHTLSYKLLPKVYIQNASIYITKPETIYNKKSPVGDVVIPFIMDDFESVDINSPLDFYIAETIIKRGQLNEQCV